MWLLCVAESLTRNMLQHPTPVVRHPTPVVQHNSYSPHIDSTLYVQQPSQLIMSVHSLERLHSYTLCRIFQYGLLLYLCK